MYGTVGLVAYSRAIFISLPEAVPIGCVLGGDRFAVVTGLLGCAAGDRRLLSASRPPVRRTAQRCRLSFLPSMANRPSMPFPAAAFAQLLSSNLLSTSSSCSYGPLGLVMAPPPNHPSR